MTGEDAKPVLQQIDPVCELFENALQRGNRPRIEDFLSGWQGESRGTLFRFLLELEVHYRQRRGESIDPNEYRARFSDFSEIVHEVFGSRSGSTQSASGPSGGVAPVTLGNYVVIGRLGQGGMGTVYKARHRRMERIVALKLLSRGWSDDDESLKRFRREVVAAARLAHPNVVTAYDADESKGVHFLAMEFVEGETLAQLQRRIGSLRVADVCEMGRQAANGLEYAHQNGLVHRDVKPSNLMLNVAGDVKLLDLGLARFQSTNRLEDDEITSTGQIMGTIAYMSPEQALGQKDVDIRTDVYSLGATLFKLLCGSSPADAMAASSPAGKLTALALGNLPSLAEKRADLDPSLVATIDKMLSHAREDRYATPGEAAAALEPHCAGAALAGLAQPHPIDERLGQSELDETLSNRKREVSTSRIHTTLGRHELPPDAAADRPPRARSRALLLAGLAFLLASAGGVWLTAQYLASGGGAPAKAPPIAPKQAAKNPFQANLDAIAKLPPVRPPEQLAGAPKWEPGEDEPGFPDGLAEQPSQFPGVKRWQVYTRAPTFFGTHGPRISWSPDGKWYTVVDPKCTRVFEAATATLKTITEQGEVTWSADSKWMAIGGYPHTLFVRPDGSGRMRMPTGWRHGWSPRESKFSQVTGTTLNLITPATGKVIRSPLTKQQREAKGKWSPDGEWVAVLKVGAPVQLFKSDGSAGPILGKDALVVAPEIDNHYSVTVDWHPSSERIAFTTRESIQIWTTQGVQHSNIETFNVPRHLSYNAVGNRLALVVRTGPLLLMTEEGETRGTYDFIETPHVWAHWVGQGRIVSRDEAGKLWLLGNQRSLAVGKDVGPELGDVGVWSPDGNTYALGGWMKMTVLNTDQIQVKQRTLFDLHRRTSVQHQVRAAWAKDSRRMLVCDGVGAVTRYDLDDLSKPVAVGTHNPHLVSLAWDPKGQRLATGSESGEVQIWAADGHLERVLPIQGRDPAALAWHPDGRHLAIALAGSTFEIWDAIQGKQVTQLVRSTKDPVDGFVAFHPQQPELLAVANLDETAVWNWREETSPQQRWSGGSRHLRWLPDSDALFSALAPTYRPMALRRIQTRLKTPVNTLQVFPMTGGKQDITLPIVHWGSVAFSPDGQRVFVYGDHGAGCIVDVKSRKVTSRIDLTSARGDARRDICWLEPELLVAASEKGIVAFSPDGKLLPDAFQGKLRTDVRRLAVSPDRRWLTVASKNSVLFWDAKTGKLMRKSVLLADNEAVVMSSAGEILWKTPDALKHLVYRVAREDSEIESGKLMTAEEFLQLVPEDPSSP